MLCHLWTGWPVPHRRGLRYVLTLTQAGALGGESQLSCDLEVSPPPVPLVWTSVPSCASRVGPEGLGRGITHFPSTQSQMGCPVKRLGPLWGLLISWGKVRGAGLSPYPVGLLPKGGFHSRPVCGTAGVPDSTGTTWRLSGRAWWHRGP